MFSNTFGHPPFLFRLVQVVMTKATKESEAMVETELLRGTRLCRGRGRDLSKRETRLLRLLLILL